MRISQTALAANSRSLALLCSMKGADRISKLLQLLFTFVALAMPTMGQALPPGLVSRWLADGNANDVENLNNGMVQNGVTFAPGKAGQAFSFDGQGAVVVIPNSPSLNVTSSFTIAVWAFRTSAASLMHLVGKRVGCGSDLNFYQLPIGGGGIPSAAVPLNAWTHLAITYNGSQALGYANGVLVVSGVATLGNNTAPLTIGNSGTCAPFAGLIDDVQLYNRPLSQLEIQSIMQPAAVSTVTQILPQLAFGGGWYTALYFTNISSTPVSFTVNFIGNDGNPLNVPAVNGSSVTVNLAARGTTRTEIPNTGPLVQGYVSAALPAGVAGYAVFRQSVPGVNDQEAVVPLSGTTATTSTLLFDDTKYVTGVAVVNLASVSTTISVLARDNQGNTIGTSSIPLAAHAKTAVVLRDLAGLAGVAGAVGSVDFTASIGNLAALGLRFNGAAFTSIPTSDR
jgi:hypothetical protein